MKETKHISHLMLERYRLGEVSPKEKMLVEAELAELRPRLDSLEASDRELRRLYPFGDLPAFRTGSKSSIIAGKNRLGENSFNAKKLLWLCAAAVFLCVLFPAIHFLNNARTSGETTPSGIPGPDRIKGTETSLELSIFLRESVLPPDEGRRLSDRTLLREGSTIQLAYTTPPGLYYGVIFSIDGRSVLTLHYPYRKEQPSVLVSGKRTFLNEAYTLDDAPDFEIFFMVISKDPLDPEKVLQTAGELARDPEKVLRIAGEPAGNPKTAAAKSASAFSGCEVETVTIRKQN